MTKILTLRTGMDRIDEAMRAGKPVRLQISPPPGFVITPNIVDQFRTTFGSYVAVLGNSSAPTGLSTRLLPDTNPLARAADEFPQLSVPVFSRIRKEVEKWIDGALDKNVTVELEVEE